MQAYWLMLTLVKLGLCATDRSWTGECTFICRMCVSRPFWWFESTAIWIMKVLIGLLWMSLRGTRVQPDGSWRSIWSTSVRSLKWLPALIEILKYNGKYLGESSLPVHLQRKRGLCQLIDAELEYNSNERTVKFVPTSRNIENIARKFSVPLIRTWLRCQSWSKRD